MWWSQVFFAVVALQYYVQTVGYIVYRPVSSATVCIHLAVILFTFSMEGAVLTLNLGTPPFNNGEITVHISRTGMAYHALCVS